VLYKVFDDNEVSPYRVDRILQNAIHTAFATEDPTLFIVLRELSSEPIAIVISSANIFLSSQYPWSRIHVLSGKLFVLNYA